MVLGADALPSFSQRETAMPQSTKGNKTSKSRKASTSSSRKKMGKGGTAKKTKTDASQPVESSATASNRQPTSSESAGLGENEINRILGAKPLESFFPSLVALPSVQTALRKEFGKHAPAIVSKMKAGESLSDEELGAHDTIHDLIQNNSVVADSLAGWSSAYDDTFAINIMQFGSVFWIEAMEFDDIGYFDTLKDAKEAAEANYEPFITEASEHKH
jgi:hypothetical protein